MAGRRGRGEGSIYQRDDGRWSGYVTLEGGKRKFFYGEKKSEVSQQLNKALHDQQEGLLPNGPSQTVGQFLVHWLDNISKPTVRPRTYLRYKQLILKHALPVLGKRPLTKLSPQDLHSLYGKKVDEGLAPRTVGHLHRVLHRALEDAVRWNYVPRNVCGVVDPPRVIKQEMNCLDVGQCKRLLAAASGDPLEALYTLALTTGMRQGELLGLKWQDIDWDTGKLQVRRSIARVTGQGFVEMEPKSAKSRRSITLASLAITALRGHKERQEQARALAGSEWAGRDLVFCNAFGRPLEPQNILRRSFIPLLERASLPRIRFHDLRHSVASVMLSQGTNPKIVQELLGHSQISLTLDTYSHVLPTLQQDAVDRLNDLLGS